MDEAALQSMMGGGGGGQQGEDQAAKKAAMEEARTSALASLMTTDARARLARIALVKPEKARAVEEMIIMAGRRGQLGEKVSDERLLTMLEQLAEKEETSKPKVTIQRRRYAFDDDD